MGHQPIDLEVGWTKMFEGGIQKLVKIMEGGFKITFEGNEWMDLYTTVYNMCIQKPPHNWSEQLYTRYSESVANYLKDSVLPSIREKHDVFMLTELSERWKNHELMISWLSRFFSYLNRFYIKRHSVPTLVEVGTNHFRTIVFEAIKRDTQKALLELIVKERNGEQVDRFLMKNVIEIFVAMSQSDLDVYIQDFEDTFLVETSSFYKAESQKWVEQDSFPDYMKKAEERIKNETERVKHYLHSTTEEKLLLVVDTELLVEHQAKLLEKEKSGCVALLNDDKKDDISRMYRLFNRLTNGLQPIAAIVKQHITEAGLALVKEFQTQENVDQIAYIERLLEMHDKYSDLVTVCFSGHAVFHKAMKEAFESFVNKDVNKSGTPEMMSNYCDHMLKVGAEKLSEEKLEEVLDKVVRLFSYLSDKDMFVEYYRKQLAKRLLLQRYNDDSERSMIQKLKVRCGTQFTSKLAGMITDMNLSKDMQNAFANSLSEPMGYDVSVHVLTTGFWPTYKTDGLILPQELTGAIEKFKAFYNSRTSHRTLRWIHAVGQVVLKSSFGGRTYELNVSTYQACILLLFNTQDSYTFGDICKALQISHEDLKRYVVYMIQKKCQIFRKEPAGKEIKEDDQLIINPAFKSDKRKIKIPQAIAKISAEEKEQTKKVVDDDRKHAIEAAIVRVMKSRKTLDHEHLVMEVTQQLGHHFTVQPKTIKQRIEDLIAREYLERSEQNSKAYNYLA
eukprot:GFYU01003990.1.p1 GENE.GFYU01003990.1~~GFYU01003990.1.p1  ORF type:complete len:730 (-),score=273.89 GFYU01003990.1:441-2630(-)